MALPVPLLLLLAVRGALAILTDGGLLGDQLADEGGARCARRVQRELDSMRRSASGSSRSGHGTPGAPAGQLAHQATIDLTGYALHQPLRTAPYDMYVTGMRVRVPVQTGWVRVERCQFDARNHSLDTRLLFRDMTVTGHIKLYEDAVRPAGTCTMTLRLRRAGLGFTAVPAVPVQAPGPGPGPGRRPHTALPLPLSGRRDTSGIQQTQGLGLGLAPLEVRTDARFVDPDFVSVYAHGCPAPGNGVHIEHRSDNLHLLNDQDGRHPEPSQDLDGAGAVRSAGGHDPQERDDDLRDLSGEMEDVFLRGIRTLLARYMERRLQPALRDAVMAGMGYSVSYGR